MNKQQPLNLLETFLSIPSISTDDAHLPDMQNARDFLRDTFESMGFTVRMLEGKRHPAVFAEKIVDTTAPTVLIYGHYDVQPADPLEQWNTPAFEPTILNNKIYARGATDNKGQVTIHIMAAKTLIEQDNLKINLKFVIEGEEEIGSVSVEDLAQKYAKDLFKADYIVVSDSEMTSDGKPAIDIGLRGLVYTEIVIETATQDLHSGQFGGVAENPAIVLAHIISKLKNETGRILIPGFYDDVIPPTDKELQDYSLAQVTEKELKHDGNMFGVGGGEIEYSLNERRWSRPTLDVNGMVSGFTGEGSKTIIPAKASAKISIRLVPNQDPQKIYQLFEQFVRRLVPESAKLTIMSHSHAYPYKAPTDHPIFEIMKSSLKKAFGFQPVFQGVGGSIGFIPVLADALKIPCIMVGFGRPDENLHSPNEHFSLDNYYKGIEAMVDFYYQLPINGHSGLAKALSKH
jgi:acetylornithine deacetylase/succinyl-diaminopimelate desuccinylase-like protein